MCGFADFRKASCGSFRIFGKVYEDFWSDTPLVNIDAQNSVEGVASTLLITFHILYGSPLLS